MSVRARRICAWLVGSACLAAIVALVLTAILDLEIGDRTSSVVAGVTALVGLALSVITLLRSPNSAQGGLLGPGRATVRSRGRRAIAAGGHIRGNAIGKGSKVTGSDIAAGSYSDEARSIPDREVSAQGTESLSAGGDIVDNAIGEDSER